MPIKWDKAALNPQSFNETIFTSIGGLFGAVELSEKNTKKKPSEVFFPEHTVQEILSFWVDWGPVLKKVCSEILL